MSRAIGPFESVRPGGDGRGRRAARAGRLRHRRDLHARPQPRARLATRSPTSRCCSPATCCSRARSAAPTCPAATTARCSTRSPRCWTRCPTRRACCPATWARRRSARERAHQPVPARARALSDRIQAPARHVRRAAATTALARDRARGDAPARSSSAPATSGSRRRRSRRPRCSRAAWGSRPTSCRRRCTPSTRARASRSRCAPRAPRRSAAPTSSTGCTSSRSPSSLWYLSDASSAASARSTGRYRQFWQVGAEAIGSDDPAVDAESILLLAEILEAVDTRELRLRLSSLGTPDTRAEYRDELQAYLRAQRGPALSQEVRDRIDLNPLRAFDADHPGTREVMAGRAAAARPPARRGPRALRDRQGAARRRRPRLRGRPDARARARLLHAHGVRVHVRRAGRPVRRRRRRPLRRADRADRRPAHARHGLGERHRADAARPRPSARRPQPPLDLFVAYARPELKDEAFRLAADARRAGHAARRRARRAQPQGPAQAGGPRGRPIRCHPRRRGYGAEGHGDGRAARRGDRAP